MLSDMELTIPKARERRPKSQSNTPTTTLAKITTKYFLGTIFFVINFAFLVENFHQEHYLFTVAATGLSLFATEHAKEFALYSDCYVFVLQN